MVDGPYPYTSSEAGTETVTAGSDGQSTSSLYNDAYGIMRSQTGGSTGAGTDASIDPGIVAQNNFQGDNGIYAQNNFSGDPGIVANATDTTATQTVPTDTTTTGVTDGTTGTVTDGTTATTTTDGTTATDTTTVSPDVMQASQAATQELVRRMLDDPTFMFAMKTASDNMSQQGFGTFLNFAVQDLGAYPQAGDQEILLDAANKAVGAGVNEQEFATVAPYLTQAYFTDQSSQATDTTGGTTTDTTGMTGTDTTGAVTTDTTGAYTTDTTGSVTTDTTGAVTTDTTGSIPTGTDMTSQVPTDDSSYVQPDYQQPSYTSTDNYSDTTVGAGY